MQITQKQFDNFQVPDTIKNKSFFVSFEGFEGAGKSTILKYFMEYLKTQGFNVVVFREPGGTEFGEKLRDAILSQRGKLSALAEAYLFASARAELLEKMIFKKLEEPSTVVILDRFIDSSLVYQGVGANLGMSLILEIHSHYPLNYLPHLTFLLDIDLETSRDRMKKRGTSKDYFELQDDEYFKKLIEGYRVVAQMFANRVKIIDAKSSEVIVKDRVIECWQRYLRDI
ncbi:MAG: dTMP kinase [Oligoflexia bacterium]|nr:dTMP kinase [Oligoflexia bacterium]